MRRFCKQIARLTVIMSLGFGALSCQEELIDAPGHHDSSPVKVGFHTGEGQTKTEMLENGLSAVWCAGDEMAVWAKNSSGAYTLSNQKFGAYGIDYQRGFFTSTLDSAMPEDTYTYYCCYPVPASVNGTQATVNIPSVQDGKASGGVDVMVATPVEHGALTAIPDPEDHSGMHMSMNRMMHQFRFFVPEEDELLGDEKFERIVMTFPSGVVGDVTFDFQNPDIPVVLSNPQADVELDLARPIGVSTGDDYQFACLSIAPVQFAEGDSLRILKAYSDDKIAFFDPIYLKAKKCEPGHSTPVKLKIREIMDYAGIIYLTLGANNLGENPQKIILTAPEGCIWGDGGSNVYTYDPGREIAVGEVIAIKFETDLDSYLAFSNQEISVAYDSENAIMYETLTMPAIETHGSTSVSLTIPYLLYEDFSCVYAEGESYGNNSYASEDRNQPGYSLDGCMSHTGWSAARYWTTGNSMRINTRYQCVSLSLFGYELTFASYHYGRLDTPPLSGLKTGKSVNLSMTLDAGGYLHESSSAPVSDMKLCIGTHTNAGVLDGIPTGTEGLGNDYETTLSDFGKRQDSITITNDYGGSAFSATFPTFDASVTAATSDTRIVFYPILTGGTAFACNAELNVYIDNIKVQIAE